VNLPNTPTLTGTKRTLKTSLVKPHPSTSPRIASKQVRQLLLPNTKNTYGDWASIAIGGQYYLVADYHPAHKKIRIGIFTSPSLDQKFELIGELGSGHPDPDIGFAEGKFYLLNQTNKDYVSPGPWVEKVEARVGVDTSNDGKVDTWSDWQELKEQYDYIKGFSKQVKRIPASMDLSKLPEGYGFCFELKLSDTTKNKSKPMLDSIEITF
jgi:hypothetical protein